MGTVMLKQLWRILFYLVKVYIQRFSSYIIFHNKLFPIPVVYINKHLLGLLVPVGQELRKGLLGWLGLKISHEAALKCCLGLYHLKVQLVLDGTLPR
jgi:hypothetical protein